MTLTNRLAIAMILLVAIAVSAVGWLSYRSLEKALLPRVLERSETHARFVAAGLQSYIRGGSGDITTFQSAATVTGLMLARLRGTDPADQTTESFWRERLEGQLAGQMAIKPAFALRLIGVADGHREIVRVDRSGANGAVRIVPEAELQRVGDVPYFRDTIKLTADEAYVSSVTLDVANGVIATPHVPTLQIAKPVMAPDGTPFGIVVIDADLRPAFDRVRASMGQGQKAYVIDRRGDYLIHPDPALEFGSQLGTAANWRNDFPDLAASLGASQGFARILPDQAGRQGALSFAPAVLADREWVAVVETVPNDVFMAPAAAIASSSLVVGLFAVLCAAVLAVFIARSLTRPIVQLTAAVEGASGNGNAAIPVDAGGEIGVLAKAFARVMGEANSRAAALEREVEEHRRTEAARDHHAARERQLSTAVELSNDAIIMKSLDGTITGWNPAAERLFGYTAEEAIGRNSDLIVTADRTREARDIERRIGHGESIEHYETTRLHRDGRAVEVSLSLTPIRAPSGTIIGTSKTARDITERKRTAQALSQESEERRRIFVSSLDLILVTDSQGNLTQVSPSSEAILGYAPQEMIGHNAIEFIHGDDLQNTREEMRAARRGMHSRNFDSRYAHKNGRIVTLSWMGTWSEPVGRHFFIGRDMTESRRAQEALRESEQQARAIIDTALDAFVQIDESGSIRNWNPRAVAMFGWGREDALGRNLMDLAFSGPPPRRAKRRPRALPAVCAAPDPRSAPRNLGPAARWKPVSGRTQRHRAQDARRLSVQRLLPRSHRQDRGRGPAPPGRKNGSRRPADRWHRA